MTDRDTFAAAALTGLLAAPTDKDRSWDYWARIAYEAADAMLARRDGVTEPVPKEKRAEVSDAQPVAWAVVYPNNEVAVIAFKRQDAEERASASDRIVPLYRHPQPTLTDAERAAVKWAADHLDNCGWSSAALRGLLERIDGA